MTVEHEKAFKREVWGGKIANLPSGLVPARQVLDGRTIILEPLDPAVHGAALYQAFVSGSLIHVVFHQGRHDHDHSIDNHHRHHG